MLPFLKLEARADVGGVGEYDRRDEPSSQPQEGDTPSMMTLRNMHHQRRMMRAHSYSDNNHVLARYDRVIEEHHSKHPDDKAQWAREDPRSRAYVAPPSPRPVPFAPVPAYTPYVPDTHRKAPPPPSTAPVRPLRARRYALRPWGAWDTWSNCCIS
jgi:hypothetical protein